jgi:small-conductance mechanosensitive channel
LKAARRHLFFKRWLLPLLVLTNALLAAYVYALHETPWAWLRASLEKDGPLTSSEYLSFAQFVLIAATIDQFFKAAVSRFNRRSKRYHIPKLVVDIQTLLAYALTALGAALLLYDLPIKSFFAASGAITLVVAYASREWVSDIAASMQIQTTRLARIDDWLRFQDGNQTITSKVVDLDQQSVTLHDKNGTVRKIRNSRFLQMPFVNLSLNPEGAVRSLQFRLSSSLPEVKILAILENVMRYVAQVHQFHTRHLCLVSSISDGELEYSIEYRCPPQIAVNVSRHQIMQTAARFFRCANIELRSQHLQLSAVQRLSDPQHGPLSHLKSCQDYGLLAHA